MITKISASVDRRAAQKGQKAVEILAFLRSEPIKNRLIKAAQDGIPPAGAVSEALIERFGLEIFESTALRQFVGWAIRSVMDDNSFLPQSAGISIPNDRLFTKGSTYKFVAQEHQLSPESLLVRILETLTVAELEGVRVYIERKLNRRIERQTRNPQ